MANREDQKHRVQQATDIVRLIGEQIALRPKGSEFLGLCPFHDDSNPSFYVSPAKQIYKCFSCGAGGDVFSFVVNYHKMTFPEALEHLAQQAGIELERHGRGGGGGQSGQRQRIAKANEQALQFFRDQLKHPQAGKAARDYIEKRGIHPDMVAAFQLGYAPDTWDALAQTAQRRSWDAQGLLDAGLIAQRNRQATGGNRESHYDRLRHRLIFPIFDAIGRPIAFGGRILPNGSLDDPTTDAKYLNSPETALFNKSATLYGIHQAKKPIIDSKTAVIVEGYTDVIACHQAAPGGAANVVATLGTALTREHVTELRRYAEKVVLVFDADAAGQKAADRAVELFLAGELDVAIAVLPQGEGGGGLDPADLLAQEDGYEQWCGLIDNAGDALSYQFERVREQLDGAASVTGRQHAAEAYLAQLAQLGLARTGPIRRALVVQRLAELLRMGESTVNELLADATRRHAPRRARSAASPEGGSPAEPESQAPDESADEPMSSAGPGEPDLASAPPRHRLRAIQAAERQLIGSLLRDNELFHHALPDGRSLDEAITPSDLVTAEAQQLYTRIHDRLAEGESVSLTALLGDLAADQAQSLANLVTEADAEVDYATRGNNDRVRELCSSAADAILAHHRQQALMTSKRQWHTLSDDQEKARKAQRLIEALREPSPARIARPRSS